MNININKRFIHYVYDWSHYEYFLLGGYASSKSYNTAIKLILKAMTESRKFLIVRDFFNTLKESCYADLVDAIKILGVDKIFKITKSPLEIKCTQTGSQFIFRGMDNPGKIMSIKDLSVVWLEEGEGSEDFYKELKSRLRTMKASLHIIVTSNPKPKKHWLYKRYIEDTGIIEDDFYKNGFISRDGVYMHHSTFQDNLDYLPKAFLDDLLATKDPRERLVKVEGKFGSDGLKAFYNTQRESYERVMQQIKGIPHNYYFNGMDFGFAVSYNALNRMAVDHENSILYIYDEYYKNKMTEKDVVNDPDFQKFKPFTVLADGEDPKQIQYYNNEGYKFKGSKGTGTKLGNIKKLRNFDKIIISDKCVNTWKEFDNLEHNKDRWGEPIDTEFNFDAHTKDACAYGLKNYEHKDLKSRAIRKPRGF